MSLFRIRQAADLLGVSDDTVRRWAESGRLPTVTDSAGRLAIEGGALARFAEDLANASPREHQQRIVGNRLATGSPGS